MRLRHLQLPPMNGATVRSTLVALTMAGLAAGCVSDDAAQPESAAAAEPAAEEFDYDGYLEVLQQATMIDNPPETELIRVIAPEDQPDVWRSCMHDAGYEVTTTFDGGLTPPQQLPDDQRDAYALADYTCHAQYPVDQSLQPQFDTAQVDIVYDYYIDELVPCLEERGFEIEQAPTIETFHATWITGEAGLYASEESWFPYGSVDAGTLSDDEWEGLNEACPQNPSNDVLFAGED